MFGKICIVLSIFVISFRPIHSQAFEGDVWNLLLQEQTQAHINLVPNLGTRLVFPFTLDDPLLKPPFNYKLTNTKDFNVARSLDALLGQNVFLITSSGKQGSIGKLYISIGGYNLSLNLQVSSRIEDHVSDIYFRLTSDDREFLIYNEVDRIKEELEKNYRKLREARTGVIDDSDLIMVMNKGLRSRYIKQLFRGGSGDNDKFRSSDVFLDKFVYLKDHIYSIIFWIEHSKRKFEISSVLLQVQPTKGDATIVDGKWQCFPNDFRLDKCVFITADPSIMKETSSILMTLTNDQDEVFLISY